MSDHSGPGLADRLAPTLDLGLALAHRSWGMTARACLAHVALRECPVRYWSTSGQKHAARCIDDRLVVHGRPRTYPS